MSQTRARANKFQSEGPITSRPEERIAAQTAQRRAEAAAARPALFGLGRPSPLTAAILFFALVGLAIAAYTTVVHYVGPSALACTGGGHGHESSCEQVQFSIYNHVGGIPVTVLGLVGYTGLLASLSIRGRYGEYGRALGFLIALIGFLFSLYLTYREAFSLHHYCEWCLGSAVCMTVLMLLTGVRFLRAAPGS